MPPKAKPCPLLTSSTRSPSDLQKRRRLSLGPMPLMRQNRRAYFQAFCKALKNPNGDSESGGAAELLGLGSVGVVLHYGLQTGFGGFRQAIAANRPTSLDLAPLGLHPPQSKLLRLADTSIGVSEGFALVSGSLVAIKLRKRNRFQREREEAYRVE